MASILLKHIYKAYPHSKKDKKKEKKQKLSPYAVRDFNLEIQDGEFIVLVGPSGCGKSTTLRMIAGLEDISAGELYINNVLANNLESSKRDIAMVFQSYALYPHMTSYQNMSYGLKLRKDYFPIYKIDNQEEFNKEKKNVEQEYETKKKEGLKELKKNKTNPIDSKFRKAAKTSILVSGIIRALFYVIYSMYAIAVNQSLPVLISLLMIALIGIFGFIGWSDLNRGKQRKWLVPFLVLFVSSVGGALYLLRNPEKEIDDEEVEEYKNDLDNFVYQTNLEKQNALSEVYDKYQSPVMTYDHKKVDEWRRNEAEKLTKSRRPDLMNDDE